MTLNEFYKVLDEFCNSETMHALNNGPSETIIKNPRSVFSENVKISMANGNEIPDKELKEMTDRILGISEYWGTSGFYMFDNREFMNMALALRDMLKMRVLAEEASDITNKLLP